MITGFRTIKKVKTNMIYMRDAFVFTYPEEKNIIYTEQRFLMAAAMKIRFLRYQWQS